MIFELPLDLRPRSVAEFALAAGNELAGAGELEQARRLHTIALHKAEQAGDAELVARVLCAIAATQVRIGRFDVAAAIEAVAQRLHPLRDRTG